jgi:ADP-heptose:LPS heptosyltransferase
LENNPYIDRKIYYPYAFYDRNKTENIFKTFYNIIKLIILVRKLKINLFIDLRGHLKTLLISYLSGANFKIGKSNGWRGFYLSKSIQFTDQIYEKDNNLKIINLCSTVTQQNLILYPSGFENKKIADLLFDLKPEENKWIALIPYAPVFLKRLPADYWTAIIKFLNKEGFKILILGGEDSKDFIDKIKFDISLNKNLAGKLSINETWLLFKSCISVISMDTAGAHIATAANCNLLVFFTYSNPKQWLPEEKKIRFFHEKLSCYPCKVPIDMENCKNNNQCVKNISYEVFLRRVKDFIESLM